LFGPWSAIGCASVVLLAEWDRRHAWITMNIQRAILRMRLYALRKGPSYLHTTTHPALQGGSDGGAIAPNGKVRRVIPSLAQSLQAAYPAAPAATTTFAMPTKQEHRRDIKYGKDE
jgi:hypothetical protein